MNLVSRRFKVLDNHKLKPMKKSILFMLFLLLTCYSVFGQISVKGKVVDENGQGLPSVTIKIKGTEMGTLTDINGEFEIVVRNENESLIFSFVGYEKVEQDVSQLKSMSRNVIILKEDKNLKILKHLHLHRPLKISYWSGLFYNPYGILANLSWKNQGWIYRMAEAGFSTNFNQNTDFYGKYGRRMFRQFITYKFQQTTFIESESKNKITTHLLENNHDLRYFDLTYGIGYQKFKQEKTENISTKNIGLSAGISKYIPYFALCSVKSFYWQDYWAWEANITKEFKRKIYSSISYRQTTQDFKEVNLTLGYIF